MATRDAHGSAGDRQEVSFEPLLSPCETYEGSRHYEAFVGDEDEVDGDGDEVDGDEVDGDGDGVGDVASEDPASTKTVIMSPALLAELRTELREQASHDAPDARPTRRSMPAARL